MNIKLTPEQAKLVHEQLKSGHYESVEELIAEALQALQEKALSSHANTPNGAQAEAVREMLDFVENNCARLEGVTVKQLIHEGHRL